MSARSLVGAAVAAASVIPMLLITATTAAADELETVPPAPPPNVRVVDVTEATVSMAWDYTEEPGELGYTIVDSEADRDLAYAHGNDHGTALKLVPETTYVLKVVACDRSSNCTPSEPVTVTTTADTTAPSKPLSIRKVVQTPESLQLSWAASHDRAGVVDYVVSDGTRRQVVAHHSYTGTFYATFDDLTPGTFTYSVRARDGAGNLSEPAELTVTIEHEPPTAPSNLRIVTGTEEYFDMVAWDAATDNSDEPLRYEVFIGSTFLISTSDLTTSIQGALVIFSCDPLFILPSGVHDLTVRAKDSSGNVSERSNAIPFHAP